MRENPVSQRAELEVCRLGGLPQRNNVGACVDATGRQVRYGLMNKSKRQNEVIKSSDWIVIMPRLITLDMVGSMIGVFGALETKASDWSFNTTDPHTAAQAEYHRVVRAHGGLAGFVQSDDDVRRILLGKPGL